MVQNTFAKYSLFLAMLLIFLLVVSCTPLIQKPGEQATSTPAVAPMATDAKITADGQNSGENAEPSDVAVQNFKPKITIIPPKEKPQPQYESEVDVLITKAKSVVSYQYAFDASKGGTYTYFISGALAKKVYVEPVKLRDLVYYNEVYLDLNQKKGIGVCTKGVSTCTSVWKQAFPVNFDLEKVEFTPQDLITHIPYSAHVVGEERVDNQETSIVEFTNAQGRKERLWLDQYSGLPLKEVIYSVDTEEEKELEKHTFTRIILGVKKSEVTFPDTQFEMRKE